MAKIKFFDEINHETASIICVLTSFLFGLIHILYMSAFFYTKSYILAYYNIFSIFFYLFFIIAIKKGINLQIYFFAAFFEIVLYVLVAIFLVGWDYGFQHMYLGLIMLIFYGAYMIKKIVGNNAKPIFLSLICAICYLVMAIAKTKFKPMYDSNQLAYAFNMLHIVIVLAFDIVFAFIFAKTVYRLEDKLHGISVTDPLTNIYNRKGISEIYNAIIGGELDSYVVAIYDIDNFKRFNDKYGHPFGDRVLAEVARNIKLELPDSFACRWGGEEFISIIKKSEDENTYEKIDNVRRVIERTTLEHKGKKLGVTVTIGASDFNDFKSLEEWVSDADKKLYEGKNSGKNKLIY